VHSVNLYCINEVVNSASDNEAREWHWQYRCWKVILKLCCRVAPMESTTEIIVSNIANGKYCRNDRVEYSYWKALQNWWCQISRWNIHFFKTSVT